MDAALSARITGYAKASAVLGGDESDTVWVENLADSGAGSLRDLVTAGISGKYVRFRPNLEGPLRLLSQLPIDEQFGFTIDGRDAPGVHIMGYRLQLVGSDDFILAGLHFRYSTENVGYTNGDAIAIQGKAASIRPTVRFLVTGCSFDGPLGDGAIDITFKNGANVMGTVNFSKFARVGQVMLVHSDDGSGTEDGGQYWITCNDNWMHDCADRQPFVGLDSFVHVYHSLIERYGAENGSGNGINARRDAQVLAESIIAIPRVVGETTYRTPTPNVDGITVTTARVDVIKPNLGETGVAIRLVNFMPVVVGGTTPNAIDQNPTQVFTPSYPYTIEPLTLGNVEDRATAIRAAAGHLGWPVANLNALCSH